MSERKLLIEVRMKKLQVTFKASIRFASNNYIKIESTELQRRLAELKKKRDDDEEEVEAKVI